ncbi:hypothetical protein ABB37_06610 [Leptomonas pyrrhocoris]|uniref:Uncharacterized protein n=1 Tax=Leptomonas pyrrhocoris TaxID=157538 RepID=A0A0N0VE95_LEPPY|nr:hypothetical protein ABB37_06610 [Leptomonas pyrrhocoris]XP_015656217.1 hypothetical protein ABB37_06610 [Leptomonas pyrrhocoris]KPA77777.1 hypothetical protein ABB37_06610 [Leptomonas pyrrhocoris]KPA77778.1 hypothetical protein ABB37_06610 [Leptomonas pyrrhocoris]|eukprot:XP_015656216.1 hypothetical protein ABB37_06610 [Leptomonas pyrrhocoris]
MPLKKKEEVCGKPNQYNLQTLEYDWKELPDTHIQLPPQQPRIRDYSLAPVPAAAPPKLNPITHQPLPNPAAGPSYTPLPSPSKPAQEEVNRRTPQGRYGNNNRKDHVAELLGDGGASPAYNAPARPSPSPLLPVPPQQFAPAPAPPPVYPYDVGEFDLQQAPSRSPPPKLKAYGLEDVAVPPYRNDGYAVIQWSHDDLRRVGTSNALEAQRSYLR